jgi:hypothetical protein
MATVQTTVHNGTRQGLARATWAGFHRCGLISYGYRLTVWVKLRWCNSDGTLCTGLLLGQTVTMRGCCLAGLLVGNLLWGNATWTHLVCMWAEPNWCKPDGTLMYCWRAKTCRFSSHSYISLYVGSSLYGRTLYGTQKVPLCFTPTWLRK